MVSGYKHFSHTHKLVMHDMPDDAEVSCSGCNSSAKKTIYICWQCNFILHEQCFSATRSRKHPSHPDHSLTLVPYPTYPSNSFYCNSCKIIGTGFSYSCSECEFDLHVQCAYSISDATNHPTTSPHPHNNSQSHQETMPPDMHNCQYSAPTPVQNQYPVTSSHPHSISHHQEIVPPHLHGQYSSMALNLSSVSIPNQTPLPAPVPVHAQYLVASPHLHNLSYQNHELMPPHTHGHNSSMVSNFSTNSNPISTPIRPPSLVPAQYSTNVTQDYYMTQNASQFSQISNTSSPNAYVSQNFTSVPPNAQSSLMSHNNNYVVPPSAPSEHRSQDSYMTQNVTSYPISGSTQNPNTNGQNAYVSQHPMSVPPSSQNSSIPHNNTYVVPPSAPNEHPSQDSYTTQNATSYPVPTSTQNPNTSSQNSYVSQPITSVPPSPQSSSTPNNNTYVVLPSAPNEQVSHYDNSSQNKPKNVGIKHFSHPHGLVMVNLKRGKRQIACSGCEETLVGKGYACVEGNCGFQLDESCFNLEKEIEHKSHPAHKLVLLSSSSYQNGTFTCNACFEDGSGFTYHCSICQHDLHVKCATLKERVKRDDHDHELKLFYECPLKGDDYTFYCDVCNRVVHQDHWTYYCKECDYGTHLDCVDREVCEEASDDKDVETLAEIMEINRIHAISRQNMLDNV